MHSPERHLGLTPVTEVDPTEAINTIREAVEKMVNLDQLLDMHLVHQLSNYPML